MHSLQNNILKTLAYFDIFDYPLTGLEIKRNLLGSEMVKDEWNMAAVLDNLAALVKEGLAQTKNGFFFLPRRREIVKTRGERYRLAEKKYKKAKRIGKLLAQIPFVRMVAVCNTLAYSNSKLESDIDLFIITAPKRIWTVRFLSNSLLKGFFLRPSPRKTQDKICLSFFVSEKHLNLEHIALQKNNTYYHAAAFPNNVDDPYLCYWITDLAPLYAPDEIYPKFAEANRWVKNFLPFRNFSPPAERRIINLRRGERIKYILECLNRKFYGDFFEFLFKQFQLKIMPSELKEKMNPALMHGCETNKHSSVVINDEVLKFHEKDAREVIRSEFQKRCEALGS